MKIYTKTGDKGTTRLVDGSCVEKHNPRVEAYGTVDELNSYLGVLLSEITAEGHLKDEASSLTAPLQKIQHHLFRIGSLVATDTEKGLALFNSLPQIEDTHIVFLEHLIDDLTTPLEPLKSFILPSGHRLVAHTHVVRTLSRRAERRVSEIYVSHPDLLKNVLIYLNRLSDYFFTLARYLSFKTQSPEVKWDKSQ